MDVNAANLKSLYTGFSAAFMSAFAGVNPLYTSVATIVPSTTAANEYGFLLDLPGFREWIGDRHVKSIANAGYTLRNKHYERTIGVNKNNIEDDNIGIYAPLFSDLGYGAAVFPEQLVWPMLKAGFTTNCYDGQYFFDTDHSYLDENGNTITVSNTQGGAGEPWFLLDTSRPLKPLIFQSRKAFDKLVRKDRDEDENVFNKNEYQYGSDGRCSVGFGFWQMAFGSKQTLNAANYAAARAAMMSFKGDGGRPLGVRGKLLVTTPNNEAAARALLQSQLINGGESNPWAGTAELMIVEWLA